MALSGFDRAWTGFSLVTAEFVFAIHLRHDVWFLLGLSCKSGCACHSLVVSSDDQRIEKRNHLGPGAWEAAGASTRGRQVSF